MSWRLGRPIFGRLPAVYRNDNDGENPSNWLTRYWDEMLVEIKRRAENFYELYLNPATAPEEWLDGMVAPMCGFTEEYYDPTWDLPIKRALCLNAYSYIWENRGAGHVLDWMLALHQIPTFPEDYAYFKPEWLRWHDRVKILTQDLELSGTSAEKLATIAEALSLNIKIEGNLAIIPASSDPYAFHDILRAIQRYQLPYLVVYDRFYWNLSQWGDPLLSESLPPNAPRSFRIPNTTTLPCRVQHRPFDAWIRLQPQVQRSDITWKLAADLHDLYTPIYIEGGACYDYFRYGRSAYGEPFFDAVFERAKPISLALTTESPDRTSLLFQRFIEEWEMNAFTTDLGRGGFHIRMYYPNQQIPQQWNEAQRLIELFTPWLGSIGWDYFRVGVSRWGDRWWDWIADRVRGLVPADNETLLKAIDSTAQINGGWAVLDHTDPDTPIHWNRILELRDRWGLTLKPCYDVFVWGKSHWGEPILPR